MPISWSGTRVKIFWISGCLISWAFNYSAWCTYLPITYLLNHYIGEKRRLPDSVPDNDQLDPREQRAPGASITYSFVKFDDPNVCPEVCSLLCSFYTVFIILIKNIIATCGRLQRLSLSYAASSIYGGMAKMFRQALGVDIWENLTLSKPTVDLEDDLLNMIQEI